MLPLMTSSPSILGSSLKNVSKKELLPAPTLPIIVVTSFGLRVKFISRTQGASSVSFHQALKFLKEIGRVLLLLLKSFDDFFFSYLPWPGYYT